MEEEDGGNEGEGEDEDVDEDVEVHLHQLKLLDMYYVSKILLSVYTLTHIASR